MVWAEFLCSFAESGGEKEHPAREMKAPALPSWLISLTCQENYR